MPASKTKLTAADFVHLHNHTQYSLLDGLTKIPALLDMVKASGMQAVAITDHGTMSGVIEFYKEAKDHNVKPIIGMEGYVASRTIADKDPSKDKAYYHLTLIAMNNKGYQNLMRLSTIANLEGMYYRPRIDHTLLEKYHEGLIILSGCIGGEVADNLRQGQYAKAKEIASWYKKIFGNRYYLELQDHGHPDHPSHWAEQTGVNEQLLKLGKELGIPAVITCDAHYLKHDDQEAHEILLCVQTGSFLSDEKRMTMREIELHVTDPAEIIKRWGSGNPELICNSSKIAERCDVTIELGKILVPKFPVPKGDDEISYLQKLVYRGLAWRYGSASEKKAESLTPTSAKKLLSKEIIERADYELGVIGSMGFSGYFLIVQDFINWGKDQGIVFGPGRGSTAGSIVAYALNVTELDPLKYDLLFERFLNPDRVSMPDADIDIQDSRRDEVIAYCIDKYGSDRVANIVTFGRMAARNAVRDVARVLEVSYADADRLAKMIPPPVQGRHIPLSQSLKDNAELKHENASNEQSKRVFDLAIQMEGTIRSHGVHAAGVVIAPDDIVKFAPLELAQKGVVATQYSMGPVEELGLLKIDFLGLSNLTIIKNALRIVKRVYGKNLNIDHIPLDDSETYQLFQRGDTTGVFQFESAGMKRYLKELQPTQFDDLIAMNALYRPGPMQWIEEFVARKHGHRQIEYAHPIMKNALENTYGIMVFQEQVMQIAKDLCGFTGGQADTLRKAIGKKKRDVLAKMKQEFIDGAVKTNGVNVTFVEKLWKELEKFADYAFPKAHASCYALIAYWTAYLKANYPAAFMAALMTSDYDNTDRLAIEIMECQHLGMAVLPPDVNESFVEFAVVPGDKLQIRFGMNAIKNVGTAAVEEILRAREAGSFTSLEDFFAKVNGRIVNRKALESLIKAGAFDRFGDRSTLLFNLDVLLAYATRLQKQAASGQTDLFGAGLPDNDKTIGLRLEPAADAFSTREQLNWERELLGLYLSQHPLADYEQFLGTRTIPLNELKPEHDGKSVTIGGTVTNIRAITTKRGQQMAFVTIEDRSGSIELLVFPQGYQKTANLWERDRVVMITGKINARDREGNSTSEIKVSVDQAQEVTLELMESTTASDNKTAKPPLDMIVSAPMASLPERIYIRLNDTHNEQQLLDLKQTLDQFKGDTEVVLVLGADNDKQVIKLPNRIDRHVDALSRLEATVGAANIKIQ